MTELEYTRKRQAYATSNAPANVIDEAIKALDAEWQANTTDSERAKALAETLVEVGELDDID